MHIQWSEECSLNRFFVVLAMLLIANLSQAQDPFEQMLNAYADCAVEYTNQSAEAFNPQAARAACPEQVSMIEAMLGAEMALPIITEVEAAIVDRLLQ